VRLFSPLKKTKEEILMHALYNYLNEKKNSGQTLSTADKIWRSA